MLRERVLVSAILLPVGMVFIYVGGIAYALFVTLILALAANEYVQLFRTGGYQPAGVLVLAGVVGLALGRAYDGFDSAPWITSLVALGIMTYHLVSYERGRDQAGTDFGISLGGVVYFGWVGSYLISLRQLPEGLWWFLLALPVIWFADSGAYFIGKRWGKHKLSPRLSPKKTWEGYLAGIVWGVAGGVLLAALWGLAAGRDSSIAPWHGAVLGLLLSILTPLGDLGESMVKRQVGVKDSGKLLPGHGGAWDRIDSWLWAGVLGYYLIIWLF
ncbi:MAG TPA: phosphatidate cytidylyltransferase [Robiginitalea sp.]|nr:phosphatidate cytidylyltransferase [Robiginitalea sp.]